MKKFLYPILFIVFLAACEEEDEKLEFLKNAENRTPTFFRFDDALADTVIISEGDSRRIRVETPQKPGNTDARVELSVSGPNADELGSSIMVSNGTLLGEGPEGNINEVTIDGDRIIATIENFDTIASLPVDLRFTVVDNNETNEPKYITLTLESASVGETAIGVGDNTGAFKSIVLQIADDDCESDLAGAYNSVNCYPDPVKPVTWTEDAEQNGRYEVTDITGGYYAFAGVPSIPAVLIDKCGNITTEEPAVVRYSNGEPAISLTATGTVREDGTIFITWVDEMEFDVASCTTEFTPL